MFKIKESDEVTEGKDLLLEHISELFPSDLNNEDVVFFCIGTDRSTGDSLGPVIGTLLEDNGYRNVMGTIDDPVHGGNMSEKIDLIPIGKTVIAIDACLGREVDIGKVFFGNKGVKPGSAVGKVIPPVGDFSIKAVVNVMCKNRFEILQCTRLKTIKDLSFIITSAICHRFKN